MFISDFAIRRPIVTVTAMVALVVFGIFALLNLHTDEFPDIQQPVVGVTIVYPGASPSEVTREIIDPVEDAIFGISGVDGEKSTCSATDGLASCTIFFEFEKPIQQASQDIRDAISTKRADLPTEMEEPVLTRFDPSELPVVTMTLTSETVPATTLTRLADPGVTRALRAIGGVAQVSVVGGIEREMTVELQPAQLEAAGVSVAQVVQALQAQNLAAPVGRLNGGLEERTIRLRGRPEGPTDFAQLVVAERNGNSIRLGQVAKVYDGTEEPRTIALYNGRQAVGVEIIKSKGYSTTQVSDQIRARVAELQHTMPKEVKLQIVQDAGQRVSRAVANVQEALIEGALLTVLVVFLFLNSWRSTVITGLALPVSVLASFIAVWAFGFTLNTMSLLGLSLAIGILIDDAIVVRENIVRHVEMGKDHYRAAFDGTNEIGLAVAATTFSIVAVFVPVGFMSGFAGQWFKPFALTIAAAVLVSLFVSFSLDPMLSAYWADPQIEAHERRNPIARTLERFNNWFNRQAERYRHGVAWALDHRKTMIALAAASFIAAIFLQVTIGGFGFAPDSDRSELTVTVEAPPGASLEYTRVVTEQVARQVRAHSEVQYTYSTVGSASGSGGVDVGSVYLRLKPRHERSVSQQALGKELRRELKQIGGATAYLLEAGGPGGGRKPLQLQVKGPDAATLQLLADSVAAMVRGTRGAVDVGLSSKGTKPELKVTINRGLAGT